MASGFCASPSSALPPCSDLLPPLAPLHPCHLCPQVREYEASATLFAESRAKRSELQDALKEHDGELKALRQEMDVQVGGWVGSVGGELKVLRQDMDVQVGGVSWWVDAASTPASPPFPAASFSRVTCPPLCLAHRPSLPAAPDPGQAARARARD